ncbi:hypothetical protein ACSSS7_006986 [Eimeria intestinalis]
MAVPMACPDVAQAETAPWLGPFAPSSIATCAGAVFCSSSSACSFGPHQIAHDSSNGSSSDDAGSRKHSSSESNLGSNNDRNKSSIDSGSISSDKAAAVTKQPLEAVAAHAPAPPAIAIPTAATAAMVAAVIPAAIPAQQQEQERRKPQSRFLCNERKLDGVPQRGESGLIRF